MVVIPESCRNHGRHPKAKFRPFEAIGYDDTRLTHRYHEPLEKGTNINRCFLKEGVGQTSMCLFAECCVNVLCKYFILHNDPVRDQSGLEKEIHPHASSWCTVRVRPN